jgi:hypothetical protein
VFLVPHSVLPGSTRSGDEANSAQPSDIVLQSLCAKCLGKLVDSLMINAGVLHADLSALPLRERRTNQGFDRHLKVLAPQ